jgi:transcriptional regulator with XRE-family HTH domain
MTQDVDLDAVIRARIRGLRVARGWSLDALASRCGLSASTLSRIETGHRRIAVDQLSPIARALGTSIAQLVELESDDDVVIHPRRNAAHGHTTWLLTREDEPHGLVVAKMRITDRRRSAQPGVHPGHEWFTVRSGTARLQLGERILLVEEGQSAQFSTMVPHSFGAHDGPVEILTIFDQEGERAHLSGTDPT